MTIKICVVRTVPMTRFYDRKCDRRTVPMTTPVTSPTATAPAPARRIKPAKSRLYSRYNWASIAILIQIVGALILSTGMEVLLIFYKIVTTDWGNIGQGNEFMQTLMSSVAEYTLPITGICMVTVNLLAAFVTLKASHTGRIRDYFRAPKIGAGDIILASLATLGLSNVNSLLMNLIAGALGSTNDSISSLIGGGMFSDNKLIVVISVSYVAVTGPITEEILCRGCILPAASHISRKFGIIASALLFGIMHGNVTQFINAFILGLLLGYVTLKSGSIIPAVIMHIVNNTASVIEMFIMQYAPSVNLTLIFELPSALIGIVCLVYLAMRHRDIDESKDYLPVRPPISNEEAAALDKGNGSLTYKVFFKSWAFWICFAYSALSSVLLMFFDI